MVRKLVRTSENPDGSFHNPATRFDRDVRASGDAVVPAQPQPRGILRRHLVKILGASILLLVIGWLMFFFHMFGLGLTPQERAQQEVGSVVAATGKLIILPQGETPALATVTNAATLAAQQPFFVNAQNGDDLLVYPKAAEAILYSPSRNIIVNVGPIQYPQQVKQAQAAQTEQKRAEPKAAQ